MEARLIILFLFANLEFSLSTIDLTLPELQHLANHLTRIECRKLIAALYFDSYKLNKNIENAENSVPEDVSCLKLLVHWNSSPGEGLGKTHEKLSLRLRQIGRQDLAQWLDSAVLQELEGEINKTAQEFREGGGKQVTRDFGDAYQEDFQLKLIDDLTWDYLQAVIGVIFVITASISVFLVVSKIIQRYRFSKIDTKKEVELTKRGSVMYRKFSQR